MRIANTFDVPLPPNQAWATLMDIPSIVPCMPGAELVEQIDDRSFKGKVSVRLGPVALTFAGTATFQEVDANAHRAKVSAQGTDAKGRGGANAVVAFAVLPEGDGSKVQIDTDLNLSGSVAQYGRGAGMIQSVAAQLIAQFAKALEARITAERQTAEPQRAAPASPSADRSAKSEATSPTPARPLAPPPPSKPIGGFSLLFKALWARIAGLFGRAA